jgi:formiminoglutamase
MKLPLLLSVPHAGLRVPPEVSEYCILTEADIIKDGDEGASEIYRPLEKHVAALVTTDVARAIVDMNRAEDEFWKDGVIKTHTCWDVPVYREYPPQDVIETLIERYHKPYHRKLAEMTKNGVVLGIDCHTMAAVGPPVAPDTGKERPDVCLGDVDESIPRVWRDSLLGHLEKTFSPHKITLNDPFTAGYITRVHAAELPWVMVELSRAPFMTNAEKSACVLEALRAWCKKHEL